MDSRVQLTRLPALWRTTTVVLSCLMVSIESAASQSANHDPPSPDQRLDMIETLQAQGPSPTLGDEAKVFGRLVGTWDVDYASLGKDGKWTHMAGQMIEGWVMDGHALQDLFIVNAGVMGPERQMGTTLRYFDAKVHKWHVIYVEPPSNSVVQMAGGEEGDRIVLYGKGVDSSLLRWSFNDITENSFTWHGERSRDAGKTWRLEEEYRMTRRPPGATDDPRLDMIHTLQAMGPHPSIRDRADVFGRFVGAWDVDYGEIDSAGIVSHFPGELVVGWVMDGHALQDLFIADPMAPGKERTMGTTLRFFDATSGKWHVIYIEPPTNSVVDLTGGAEGDRIVLYAKDPDGALMRWSFNDITNDAFVWRDEMSRDGGKTWRLTEEHHMKRHAGRL